LFRRRPSVFRGRGNSADRLADPVWHLPWLAARSPRLRVHAMPGVVHAPQHAVSGAAAALIAQALLPG
jgi:hypothetical protein